MAPWVSSALSFIRGVHVSARALQVLNLIWFGCIAHLSQWGGNFLVQMISICLRYASRKRGESCGAEKLPLFLLYPFLLCDWKYEKYPILLKFPLVQYKYFFCWSFCEIIMLFYPLPLFHLVHFLFFQFSKLYYSNPFNFYLLLASLIYCVIRTGWTFLFCET